MLQGAENGEDEEPSECSNFEVEKCAGMIPEIELHVFLFSAFLTVGFPRDPETPSHHF